jgi:hypothetical protein
LTCAATQAQTPTTEKEFWPKLNATFELRPGTRLQVFTQLQNSEDSSYYQMNAGAMINYRMRRIAFRSQSAIDEEDEHQLVIGAGYEYLRTIQSGDPKGENRIIVQGVGRHRPGADFLLADRNRLEFRWVNGVYDFRYRNKATVSRSFRVNKFRLTPYASGELFWDRNHHSWNENQYSFGVQLPYKKRLMLDTFYLHQNCTTCSQQHIDVFGLTLNLYFKRGEKGP